jgi:hypothetical protein
VLFVETERSVEEEATFGFFVTETMEVAEQGLSPFVLECGDLLVEDVGSTFVCLRSGEASLGLVLTELQQASLKPVAFVERGLDYELLDLEVLGAV